MATEINPAKEEVRAGGGGDDVSKKLKREEDNDGAGGERGDSSSEEPVVSLGGMKFRTSREIFEYFDSLLSSWLSSDFNVVGKDYYPMLLDLVKKGHPEPEKMIGSGLTYFHVHRNGLCSGYLTFYLRNEDVRARDFCFRSCVHNILPLPEDLMKELGTGVVVCACHLPRPKDEEVILQPRKLSTSTGVLSHFFDLLYFSPLNEPITEGRRVVLLELLRKGDPVGWENKFGSGSKVDQYSFEVRIHPNPVYIDIGLRSFFLVHQRDGSVEEFCYIKLIENISPLPEKSIDYFIHPCSCHHGGGNKSDVVSLGISKFRTSEEMVEYFRHWLFYQPLDTPITDGVFTLARS